MRLLHHASRVRAQPRAEGTIVASDGVAPHLSVRTAVSRMMVVVGTSFVRGRSTCGTRPVLVAAALQAAALLSLVPIVRDYRPNPAVDPAQWAEMGAFVEFTAIAPIAILFSVTFCECQYVFQADTSEQRAREVNMILLTLAVGTLLCGAELVSYGIWKGLWSFFGLLASSVVVDLGLTFAVLRWSD